MSSDEGHDVVVGLRLKLELGTLPKYGHVMTNIRSMTRATRRDDHWVPYRVLTG
jgi:hypothetical protein